MYGIFSDFINWEGFLLTKKSFTFDNFKFEKGEFNFDKN
jgi:hypothetical protein